MSNNYSASFDAAPTRATDNTKPSFWRRLFDAWVQSYANRADPDGNVFCEL